MKKFKCVVIGQGCVGKTYMIITHINDVYPQFDVPTVFDNYTTNVTVNGEEIELELKDTGGAEDYDRIRPLSYPDVDVAVICFSVNSPDSFEDVCHKWYPEIRKHCRNVPILLVGTKVDLRNDEKTINYLEKYLKKRPLVYQDGISLMAKIGAVKYLECSALTREGLNEVFEEIARIALNPPVNPQNQGIISRFKDRIVKAVELVHLSTKNKSKDKGESSNSKFYE